MYNEIVLLTLFKRVDRIYKFTTVLMDIRTAEIIKTSKIIMKIIILLCYYWTT